MGFSLIADLPTLRQSLDSRLRRYRSRSRPFLLDQLAIFLKVANSPKHDGPLSSFLARGTGGDLDDLSRRLTLFTGADPSSAFRGPTIVHRLLHRLHRLQPPGVHPSS